MLLISEKWLKYVEDNKLKLLVGFEREGLYEELKALDMCKFVFEIEEGRQGSMDDPLENFPSYQLSYFIGETNNKITIEVGPDFMAVVKITQQKEESKTIQFADYFKFSKGESYQLDDFFTKFGDSIRK